MQLCDAELKRDSRVPKEVASPRGRPARGVSGALRGMSPPFLDSATDLRKGAARGPLRSFVP